MAPAVVPEEVVPPEVVPSEGAQDPAEETIIAVCGREFEAALRVIEAGSKRAGLSRALQALSECPALPPDFRATARECAPLVAERRSVRLMGVLTEQCTPKSPFDLATVLSKDCAPSEVSDALLRVVDAPTAAFAAQVERQLEASQVPHRQRLIAHLLLGAAAEGEELGR
jgi:hypothetical protein